MLIIACLSQKGGVGKSTLTRLIASAYAHSKWRVKIADFNVKQKTSTDWVAMRMDKGVRPEIAAEAFTSVKSALRQEDQYDLMVMDGRPDSDTSTLDLAREADLIVIPTGVTADDLAPQVRFAHELLSKGIERRRIFFVLNKTSDSMLSIDDARAYLMAAGYTVGKYDLPMKTGYQIAQNAGRSAIETTFNSLNARAEQVMETIVTAANTQIDERAIA